MVQELSEQALSHTFEDVQKGRGQKKKHEEWSVEMVTNRSGGIRSLLEAHFKGLSNEIAELLIAEVPTDIYHAVVSSSFDADRLDYLRRDRMMTGSGAGAIDFDWLLDNLTVADIDMEADGDVTEDIRRPSFCLKHKAIQAAESFLLARYHLYTQVYLHKTTRGLEKMMAALLRAVSDEVVNGNLEGVGLEESHPLVKFFMNQKPKPIDYLALDDNVVWSAVERLRCSSIKFVSDMACRLHDRKIFKGLDLEAIFGTDSETQRRHKRRIDKKYQDQMGRTVLIDEPKASIYGEIGADDAKAHKRLMILMPDHGPRENTGASSVIAALEKQKEFVRYYFASDSAREAAKAA